MFRCKSLRLRIQLWHAVVLVLVVIGFSGTTYFLVSQSTLREIDQELETSLKVLQIEVSSLLTIAANADNETPVSSDSVDWDTLRVPQTFAGRRLRYQWEQPYLVVFSASGIILASSAEGFEHQPPATRKSMPKASDTVTFRRDKGWREASQRGPGQTTLVVGRYIGAEQRGLQSLAWTLFAVGGVLLGIGLIGGWLVSKNALRPIQRISDVAERISADRLGDRIDIEQMDDELAGLGRVLNQTFSRLEEAFERQSRFTADASHELRTPLSVMQTHQQLALAKPRTQDEYAETLHVCQRATKRMTQLVESLLCLARSDQSQTTDFQSIDISQVVADTCDRMRVLAAEHRVNLNVRSSNTASPDALCVLGDRGQLCQVFGNVLANAIHHSSSGAQVSVAIAHAANEVVISIEDQGVGIAAEHHGKIFDRFYRVDSDRARTGRGGSGLGLAICRSILVTHRGTIEVRSKPDVGSVFAIRLPLSNQLGPDEQDAIN